eukprot:s3_g23.t1
MIVSLLRVAAPQFSRNQCPIAIGSALSDEIGHDTDRSLSAVAWIVRVRCCRANDFPTQAFVDLGPGLEGRKPSLTRQPSLESQSGVHVTTISRTDLA